MRRTAVALGLLVAGGLAGADVGGGSPPPRIVVHTAGSGHLPAYTGAENPPLGGAPVGTAVPTTTGPGQPTAPPATSGTTTTSTPAPPPPAPAVALGVQETETPAYVTRLSRSSVPAGDVTVELQNVGEDPHNLRIIRSDGTGPATQFADTDPGQTSTRVVRLAPGSYRLLCTLTAPSSHDAAGMHATLTVTAP